MFSSVQYSSIQFSGSVVFYYTRPHELQHARPPCPLPTPGVHPNSRPSNRWCHSAISSSLVPFSSCPLSFPASESFQMSHLFTWGETPLLEFQLQHHSLQRNPRVDLLFLYLCLLILIILLCFGWPFCILAICGVLFIMEIPRCGWGCVSGLSRFLG